MSFDRLRQQMEQRLSDFMQSRQTDLVLSDEAMAEAAELWQAALPADPEHPTAEENLRLGAASYGLGWLHYLRGAAQPPGPARLPELARSVIYFAALSGHMDLNLPEPLKGRVGPAADADLQAGLAVELLEHARTTADQALLDASIWLFTASLDGATSDRPGWAGLLSNLGLAHLMRFERAGALTDLDNAIVIVERAVAATPDGHPDRVGLLSNLGAAYQARFERGGAQDDLDQAIEIKEQAVAATPEDHPNRAASLSNLGSTYQARFERGDAQADLDKAIATFDQAVAALPEEHHNRAAYLSNVGLAYLKRFEGGRVPADLEKAITNSERAVAATPEGHPNRAAYLTNVGFAYRTRFERDGEPADLDKSIESLQRAVASTPQDDPNRAVMLSSLGFAYQIRLDVNGQGIDREALRALAGQIAAAETGPPVHRVRAGWVAGALANAMGEHALAVELLDAAVALVPSIGPRGAGWADPEHGLGRHLGLVGEAVTAHCAINDPAGAVETAELGRGVLVATQLGSRSDLTDLDHAQPELAAEFRRVCDQLNTAPAADAPSNQSGNNPGGRIEQRKRLWAEHDQLLARIRQQDGFARFLLPPRLADLRPTIDDGAVVMVNTGSQRSDAIIVTRDAEPVHVPLPNAALAVVGPKVVAMVEVTHDNTPAGIGRRQRLLPEVLGWLWDSVVGPVLNALPPTGEEDSAPRRVWWLPTGLLGLFPLHAAGHSGKSGALDEVVSSYTPTLRALADARTRPGATARRQLTVALNQVSGLPDLPNTVSEAKNLHADQSDSRFLLDEEATTSNVLAALPEANWMHFACHAGADFTAPSRGRLALHDALLDLPRISQLRLDQAELAYLSVCSIADRELRLADESLHLASAFQAAGFRHVIAGLWPLDDDIAATAAAAFYQHLPAQPTPEQAATALHEVTLELRAKNPGRPDQWAALVHSGP